MPVAAAAMVGPADLRVRKSSGLLTCLALRTGACLCLYDPVTGVGGMAHVTHTEATELKPSRPGRYAASGIEALIQSMERAGAFRNRLLAAVVGGAEVSVRDGEDDNEPLVMDAGVCRAVELELQRINLSVELKEIGGKCDRSVLFDVASGSVKVKSSAGDKHLGELRSKSNQALVA